MVSSLVGYLTATEGSIIILFILFIVLFVLLKRLFKLLLNYIWIGVGGALFPFIANYLGLKIQTGISASMDFALYAMLLYSVYLFGRFVYKFLSGIEKIGKGIFKRKKEDSTSD